MSSFDEYLKGELSHLRDETSGLHSSAEKAALGSKIMTRSRTRRRMRLSAIYSMALALVAAGTVAAFALTGERSGETLPPAAGSTESPTPDESSTPTPSESPTEPADAEEGTVYVFFTSDHASPYEKSAYVPAERSVPADATVEEKLRLALEELVKGPTSKERDEGLGSSFSDKTAELVNKVEVIDGMVRVDFRDFTELIPEVSTSQAGAAFQFSLKLTVFQFDEVKQVEFSIEGDCARYWVFLQAGECQPPITREDWDKVE